MPRDTPGALSGLVAGAAIVLSLAGAVPGRAGIEVGVGNTQAHPSPTGSLHVELPVEGDDACVLCHEDTSRGAVAHEPAAAGLCTTCHLFTGSGDQTRVALTAGTPDDTAPLCTGCHADIGEQLTRATVHVPAATGACTGCHSPHGSDHAKLLVQDGTAGCLTCHDLVAGDLAKPEDHAPAAWACVLCHSPHRSPNAALLLEPVNTLCLECHRTRTPAPAGATTLRLFGRDVPAAEQAVVSGPVINVDPVRGVGHPVAGHPVSGPEDPAAPGRPFTCVSCHAAHGADAAHLKRFGGGNPTEFCVKCH
jgi:predicted CXXCH cytochrome family protein